jgi:hypothetical protein
VPTADPDPAPDIAAGCVDCRAIFLLPGVPVGPAVVHGTAPAGTCPRCGGLVVAIDAATASLTALVVALRRSGQLHFATVLSLAESWTAAPPSPLAVLAELSAVAPEVLDLFGVRDSPIGVRIAVGSLLLATLGPLLQAAVTHADPGAAATAVLTACIAPAAPLPITA